MKNLRTGIEQYVAMMRAMGFIFGKQEPAMTSANSPEHAPLEDNREDDLEIVKF